MRFVLGIAFALVAVGGVAQDAAIAPLMCSGELVNFPGAWSFMAGKAHIILVSDEELEALSDPDKVLDLTLTHDKREASLRQICEQAQQAGFHTLIIAFDQFFEQYRPGQAGKPRRLTPDMPEYVERIAAISKFAAQYGLGLELSLMSPLEIGPAYTAETGESGLWMHYREGLRDPLNGKYSVQLWRQVRWANNKGAIEPVDAGVRVFAFREHPVSGTLLRTVNPRDIIEITDTAQVEVMDGMRRRAGDFEAVRIRVFGEGGTAGQRDRVLVVQQYKTPEMDYFSEKALPYLTALGDRYVDAGVALNGLYSDEMHIQQDWGYFGHHDHGEFALRYVSPGLARVFAAKYGDEYADFAKYMVYFACGQEDFAGDLTAKADVQHVLGDSPEAVRQTALFRSRYYKLLQDGVVDLFTAAKRHLEERLGKRLEARAHATWAESPTIDKWNTGRSPQQPRQYEYTSNFVWSDTVHQAASACYDYFKWGDYLTGNGNDHAEGGWIDRDYFALALGCSTGILNEVPYSYAAHWGMPHEVSTRRQALVDAYGASASPFHALVQDRQHRDTSVLMLYPLDLVAEQDRFGSWMTQYGYADYITQAKLLERGLVKDGFIEVAGRRFSTVCALFEPFPETRVLEMLTALAESGGRVVWSGPPPVLLADGGDARPLWQRLTGAQYAPEIEEGLRAPGEQVTFEGPFAGIAPMTILTDFLVDRIYPVTPGEGVTVAARVGKRVTGTHRTTALGGSVTALGFRPRDDQAASLGYEERHWFDILCALGSYLGTWRFEGYNDNTDYLSRTSGWLTCCFPNGAVSIAPHLDRLEESWAGGFARTKEEDEKIVASLELPSETVSVSDFKVNGHTVTYTGSGAMTFRVNDTGVLTAFCGRECDRIAVDGNETVFADQPMGIVAWAPVLPERHVEGGAVMEMFFSGKGNVHIPAVGLPVPCHVVAQGATLGSKGAKVASIIENGMLSVSFEQGAHGWYFVVPGVE